MVAPELGPSVLFDRQRHLKNIDLLDDASDGAVGPHDTAAVGAGVERMREKRGDLFGRERVARMQGMAGLAANRAPVAIG